MHAKLWPGPCLMIGMELKINLRIFQHLSRQIAQGKPLWSLLILNEYASSGSDPLSDSIRQRALLAISRNPSYEELGDTLSEIIAGKCLSQLTDARQREVRDFRETVTQLRSKKIVHLPNYLNRKILRNNGRVQVRARTLTATRRELTRAIS